MSAAGGPVYWRRYLADCPTWALEDTLARRREEATDLDAVAIGDGFLVDPAAGTVRFRGVEYQVVGRGLDLVYALAVSWLGGRRRLRSETLSRMIWPGTDPRDAQANLHTVVYGVRQRVPDLVVGGQGARRGYWLPFGYEDAARRVESRAG